MAVKGVFASDSGITGDRTGDFASSLLRVNPTGSAPLFALTSGMKSADAQDVIITWFEENKLQGRVQITNNAGTGVTLVVDDASQITVGGVFLIETTGEYVFIEAVAGTSLTVKRGFASTAVTTINGSGTSVGLQKIGNGREEGSSKPTAVANLGFPVFNYMQIFRNSWDVTGTAKAVSYHTGDVIAKNRKDASMLHAEDIEKSLLFGRLSNGIVNDKPFRTMRGIVPTFTTNVQAQSTNTSYSDVRDFLEGIFARNIKGEPNERIAFCGNEVISTFDTIFMSLAVNRMNMTPGQTEFGFKIRNWITPYGEITLMSHPLMVESPVWTKDLHVMHPAAIRTRYLRRTTHDGNDKNGTRNGNDADFGVFTTEMSIEYKAEATGGSFTGIDTPDTTGL